jgi:hypothetical protein
MEVIKNYKKIVAVSLFFSIMLFYTPHLYAQTDSDQLRLNIQLRPRGEFRNGSITPILEGQQPAAFVSQRTRIGLTYSRSQKLQIGVSTQIVTTWGNDAQKQATANDISFYEAWAKFYFNPAWSVKVGRQVLSYDDERILGASDWNNAGHKHDAALIGYEKNKFKANAVFAFNQNAEKVTNTFFDNSTSQPYKAMEFLWMKYQFSNTLSASALMMNLAFQNKIDSSISNLQTFGGNIFYKKNKLSISGTYYYQMGNNPQKTSSTITTKAWMAAAKADYHFNKIFGLGIGSDYLSGKDMNSTSPDISYFNTLYATNHKFYGSMDYFYVSSPHSNVGLWDSYLNANINTSEKLGLQIAYHHFESAAHVMDYSGSQAGSSLGNEVDLAFGYAVMKDVKITGGYSQMFTDQSMKYVKNILENQSMKSLQNWVWLSININPDILIYKSK